MKQTIRDISVKGKKVLVRVDFNVPMQNGKITNDKKIIEAIPTIKYLIDQGAKVILCSHLGRPEGVDEKYTLKPVAKRLGALLKKKVVFASDVAGKDAKQKVKELENSGVLLLENVRFEKGETINDEKFAKKLAGLANVFVNDAFASMHRAHASTVGVTQFLPSAIGFLVEKELEVLSKVLKNPERPYVAILGGSKVADKLSLIDNLLDKVDAIVIGGAMAFTFIKALGGNVGKSIVDDSKLELANKILAKAKNKGVDVILPIDVIASKNLIKNAKTKKFEGFNIPENYMGLDIGKKTVKQIKKLLKTAKTVFWNGPVGAFEFDKFERGTKSLAKVMSKVDGITIVGGGDSANAVIKFGYENKFTHISTGGGASIEFLEGKTLPGIACINSVEKK